MTASDERLDFDCTDLAVMLSGYLDDELPPGARLAADRHLVGCAACRERVDEAERLDRLVRAEATEAADRREVDAAHAAIAIAPADPGELPAGFAERVLAATGAEPAPRHGRHAFVAWSGWLAAAAAIAFAVTTSIGGRDDAAVGPGNDGRIAAGPDAEAARAWERVQATLTGGTIYRSRLREPEAPATTPPQADASGAADDDLAGLQWLDAQALAQAAFVLDSLADGDAAEIERARRIATFDDLEARLARIARDARGEIAAVAAEAGPYLRALTDPDGAAPPPVALGALADRLETAAARIDAGSA